MTGMYKTLLKWALVQYIFVVSFCTQPLAAFFSLVWQENELSFVSDLLS